MGLTVFWSTLAAVVGLALWPKVIGAGWALATWTDAEKERCEQTAGCAVNVVPGGVVPVWWALLWVAVIVTAIVVCWHPARWWSSRGRGRIEFIADSSPKWLRVHAFVAAFICALLVLPGRGITTTWAIEYAIPAVLALAAAGLATLSVRHARSVLTPAEAERLLGAHVLVDRAVRHSARTERKSGADTKEGTR